MNRKDPGKNTDPSQELPGSLRKKAEKKLTRGEDVPHDHQDESDLKALVHELKVHQIELELQNEELFRAKNELEESELKFRDLFDFAPVGYATLDKDGTIHEMNLTGASLLGSSRKDLLGKRFQLFLAPGNLPDFNACYAKIVGSGAKQSCELCLKNQPGSSRIIQIEGRTIDNGKTAPLRMRVAFIDITERRQAVESLRESEARYRNLFESMDEGFASCGMIFDSSGKSADFRYLDVNPAFTRLTGLAKEQVIGRNVTEAIPGIERLWIETYGRIVRTGRSERIANPVAVMGRDFEVFAWRTGPSHFAAVFSDVTDRKQAEKQLRRFETFTQNARDIILFIRKKDGQIIEANKAACRSYGYTRDELLDMTVFNLRSYSPRSEVEGQMRQAGEYGILFNTVHRKKDGTDLSVEVNSFSINFDGEPVLLSIVRDVTERERVRQELINKNAELNAAYTELDAAQEQLQRTNEELRKNEQLLIGRNTALSESYEAVMAAQEELQENLDELVRKERELLTSEENLKESLAEKDTLLAEIHHRVKNNLTAFISLLSLEGSHPETAEGQAFKNELQNRARSMALIHETLYKTKKYSRVEMRVYLKTLVEQIAASYSSAAHVRILVEADDVDLDLARATPCGLIINELITNSFKYAFPPSFDCKKIRNEPCTIRVAISRSDGTYVLIVADNGIGLPEGFDISRQKSLGLKLVNFLARHQLQAKIEIDSTNGTECVIRFDDSLKMQKRT